MVDGSLLCMVMKAKSNKGGDGVFVVIKENTEIISLKYQVSERLEIPMQSLSLKFICEREKKFSISIDNDDDLNLMFEYCRRNGFTDANLYESMVHATNPESRVVIDVDGERFRRLFISYNACIEGFIAGCRPLLFLDRTFIKDRYRGMLLSATGYDGNQGIFPLAYCVCNQENEVNWKWFLQRLWTLLYDRKNPYQPPHRLVMISNTDKGIRTAVEEFFPDAFHSRCILHLVENIKKKMKDFGYKANITTMLGELLQSAAYKFTISEWDDDMKELACDRSQGLRHCNGILPGEISKRAFSWYGHVTSNVVDSFNSWIRKARLLRILPLIETIRKQIIERMHERKLVGQKWSGYLCPEAEMVLCDNIQHGSYLAIKHSTEDIVEVESNKTCRVDLKNRTYSCRSWDITRIPYKHACTTITWMG
ncbi:uncharacterized protein LOC109826739 [Asparagus officinalis]|uniref:uncharacterized protein LOC109826739 n=1 Tax=Asparagus officinalis TaxID=4686 RepID=UPI00098E3706|nr:uncharacterized protein LOC109826739 [Asparagus officinalis]